MKASGLNPVAGRLTLTVTSPGAQVQADRVYWAGRSPEERLDAVERYRIEAGKFIHEYPARLRRLLTIARIASR